ETEIKLTNIARASLEELLIDYKDFLRTRNLPIWNKDHRLVSRMRELNRSTPKPTYETFKNAIEHESPEICANAMITLVNITGYLLRQQVRSLTSAFISQGGFRERLSAARQEHKKRENRNNQKDDYEDQA